jgi:hypothetical protein
MMGARTGNHPPPGASQIRRAQHPLRPHVLGTVLLLLLLALAGCRSSSAGQSPSPTTTIPQATATPFSQPIDCPNPSQPTIQSGAQLSLQPTSGPVGVQVTVDVNGLQPSCHLFVDLEITPSLSETQGTPEPGPHWAHNGLQWVTVSKTGTIHTSFCLCQTVPLYALGYPPYPTITPIPVLASTPTNVQQYAPKQGDYFFITVAGPNIPTPPRLFAKFTITQ